MSKIIIFNQKARLALKAGLDTLANAVKVTLGPKGKNVIYNSRNTPVSTKDGVSVAEQISLEDPLEDIGAQIVKQVASKTSELAGDGTTTATVLAQAIFNEGLKHVTAGSNPMDLKRGIDLAVKTIVEELKAMSSPIKENKEIAQVASISANNDSEIGNLIAEAMDKIGKDGVISVEDSKSFDTTVEIVDGIQFERGFVSPYFITDFEKQECVLEDPLVLLCDKKISSINDILPLLESVSKNGKSLLLVADDFEGDVLPTLNVNSTRKVIKVCAVKAPGFGDRKKAIMEDLAILTGCKVISEETGYVLSNVTIDDLGTAKSIKIDKNTTTIIEPNVDKKRLSERVKGLEKQIKDSTNKFDKEKLQERLAKLSSGVAVLKIGAATELEMKEKKDRVDDALNATKAAVEEGIVPGGGVALVRAADKLTGIPTSNNRDVELGINIVAKAITVPLKQIANNAGIEGSIVLNDVCKNTGAYGYNAATLTYGNLIEEGVIDPTKVTRIALENAASIASLMLLTETVITDKPEEKDTPKYPAMPM